MMKSKINGLMVDVLSRVFGGAAPAEHASDAVKRPTRQEAPSCESLEGRVVLSNWGGADLLGNLSQIGVVTTALDAGGPGVAPPRPGGGTTQTSQTDAAFQALQTQIQGLAAKSNVTIADLAALNSDSQAIATAGGGLKADGLQTALGSLAAAVAGGADTTQAQADFNALFSGSSVDQTTIDKTFTDLVQTIQDSKITSTDLTDFAAAVEALPRPGGSMNGPGFPGAPGGFNGAGPGGDALTASLATAGITALPTNQQATPAPPSTTNSGTQSNQLQTDLDKLRTDQQTVTAKSAVTINDLDQLKTDSQNIATAGLNLDPKSLQTAINGLVSAVAAGGDTTQAQTDFNALFTGSSVSQTVIDKTFADLVQTIQDSKITTDDATLIAADQTAVQADFAALPQGGTASSGGFAGRGGMDPGGMFGRMDQRGMARGGMARRGMFGGFGGMSATGSDLVSKGRLAAATGPASGTAVAVSTPSSSTDTSSPSTTAAPAVATAAAPAAATDSAAVASGGANTFVGGQGHGAARRRMGNIMGGRFGSNATRSAGEGMQSHSSGMNQQARMMNRSRRR